MSKESGLGDNMYVGQYNLSGDTQMVDTISSAHAPFDKTGIDVFAMERIHGLRDGKLSWKSHFNPSAGQQHVALSALPTTDVIGSYFHKPATAGNPAASLVGKQIDYKASRDNKGNIIFAVDVESNLYPTEWGIGLTPGIQTLTGAGSTTGINDAVATTGFGLQAFLHVFAFVGTSATIAIQSSTDNGAGDAYSTLTGCTFTVVTGPTSERIESGRTLSVEKWLRVNVAGTFSSLSFAVNCVRNNATVLFT